MCCPPESQADRRVDLTAGGGGRLRADVGTSEPLPIPVARASLSPMTARALSALRIFALVVSAMVVYTFVSQL